MSQIEPIHPIILFGDTLFISGIETALNRRINRPIIRLRGTQLDWVDSLEQSQPSLLLFDLDDPQADRVVLLLKQHPSLRLIGLDRTHQSTLVLGSQRLAVDSMDKLAKVIQIEIDPDRCL